MSRLCTIILAALLLPFGTVTAGETDTTGRYDAEVAQMMGFMTYMFNTLGNDATPYKDKETIIYDSYSRLFESGEVQIEDDLDPGRQVALQKDVVAYLKDIDFFYQQAHFSFVVQQIEEGRRPNGDLYLKVHLNRALEGLTVSGQPQQLEGPRYAEINVDEANRSLRIASLYTQGADAALAYAQWWQSLDWDWQTILQEAAGLPEVPGPKDWDKLARIKTLDLSGSQLPGNLRGLEKLHGLQKLKLSKTGISSVQELRYLSELQSLDLSHNPIANIEALRYMRNLRELDLSYSMLSDLEGLQELNKLQRLSLKGLNVPLSLAALSSTDSLIYLDASGTRLQESSTLATATALQVLRLADTQIKDLSFLQQLAGLEQLDLSGTGISQLQVLGHMQSLKELKIDRTAVSDLAPLSALAALQTLWCNDTRTDALELDTFAEERPDVLLVANSTAMYQWWLGLSVEMQQVLSEAVGMEEPNAESISRIAQIDTLVLRGIVAPKLSQLAALQRLRVLDLSYTGLQDLNGIEQLEQLQSLNLKGNPIISAYPLRALQELKVLNLSKTALNSLMAIGKMPALQKLNINESKVNPEDVRAYSQAHTQTLVLYDLAGWEQWWSALSADWQGLLGSYLQLQNSAPTGADLCRLAMMTRLDIAGQNLQSMAPLARLWNLQHLSVKGVDLNSGQPIPVPGLKTLKLEALHSTDWTFLAEYQDLQELSLSQTNFDVVSVLARLPRLERLSLAGTPVSALRPLVKLASLQELDISNTRVASARALIQMPALSSLVCFNTRISKFAIKRFEETHPGCEVVYY